jgi:hypothetical protein
MTVAMRTVALVIAALLAGCSGQEGAAPPPTDTPSPDDAVALDAACEMATDDPTVTLDHPGGWDAGDDAVGRCQFFDPGDPDLEPGTEADVAIRWSVEPVPVSRILETGPGSEEQRRFTGVVDGHRAWRITATTTGEAALPEGIDTTTWVVDLSRSADRQATLIGTVSDTGATAYGDAVGVLDGMARQARIGAAQPTEEATVMRWSGRRGFVVTFRSEDRCLELYAGSNQGSRLDRACDLVPDQPLAATILRGDGLQVAVGLTTTSVDAIRLRAHTDAQRTVITTALDDGQRAFALPLSGSEAALVAETFTGDELGSVEVLPD